MDWVLNGNLKSMFLMSKTTLPHLIESKGAIVNISSVSGMRPVSEAVTTYKKNVNEHASFRCITFYNDPSKDSQIS